MALDAERALSGIFTRCVRDTACREHFGDPAADYQALRVPMVVGAPAINPRTTRNPAKGLLDIPRAVFVACDVVGLRLGLCDFGAGSSTDVMHLDDAPRIPSGAVA